MLFRNLDIDRGLEEVSSDLPAATVHLVRVLRCNHLVVLGLSLTEWSSKFKLLRSPAHITTLHVIGVCRHLTWGRRKSAT